MDSSVRNWIRSTSERRGARGNSASKASPAKTNFLARLIPLVGRSRTHQCCSTKHRKGERQRERERGANPQEENTQRQQQRRSHHKQNSPRHSHSPLRGASLQEENTQRQQQRRGHHRQNGPHHSHNNNHLPPPRPHRPASGPRRHRATSQSAPGQAQTTTGRSSCKERPDNVAGAETSPQAATTTTTNDTAPQPPPTGTNGPARDVEQSNKPGTQKPAQSTGHS